MDEEKLLGSIAELIEQSEKRTNERIGSLAKTVQSNQQQTNVKFEDMEKRIDSRLEDIEKLVDSRFEDMEERTDKKFENLQTQTTKNSEDIRSLGAYMENKIEKPLQLILERQSKILKQEERLTSVEKLTRENTSNIKMLEVVVADHSQKLQQQ